MQRLIDADALRERMYHEAFETDTDMQRWDGGCWIRYKMFENALEATPTVDAEPVKPGHWIEHEVGLICSECGHYTEAMYDEPFNNEFGRGWALKRPYYCGYCGAKMDEVEEDG